MINFKKICAVLLSIAIISSCFVIGSVAADDARYGYYCGFENYTQQISGISYDSSLAEIVTENSLVGEKALKLNIAKGGITAFELRDSVPFDITAGKEYDITLSYKASGASELSVGVAEAGNVTKTAEASKTVKVSSTDGWQTESFTFTPDKSTADGYVLAITVYAEEGAVLYFDDITVAYYSTGFETLDEIDFGMSSPNFPALKVFTEATDEDDETEEEPENLPKVWDRTVAENFAGGSGTSADPYLISTAEQLALAITQSGTTTKKVTGDDGAETTETVNEPYYGCYYKLTSDIYLNEIDAIDWKNASGSYSSLNSWYGASENFAGTIDGDGHVVYGIYHYTGESIQHSLASGREGSALVPQAAKEGVVKITNLGVDCSYIRDRYTAAAFVANGGADITGCYVGENVKIVGKDIGAFIGRGYANDFTLRNCYSFGTVYGNTYSLYGLVGQVYQSNVRIYNCYNANGPLTSYSNGNYSTWYKFYNSYETEVSGNGTYNEAHNVKQNVILIEDPANMQGTDVFTNEAKMPYLVVKSDGSANDVFTATKTYPVLSIFAPEPEEEEPEEGENKAPVYEIWDGKTTTEPQDKNSDGIFEITNGAELAYVISTHGGEGKQYKLTKDIYLNDVSKINWATGDVAVDYTVNQWFGTGAYFEGSIDGAGHVIHGLYNVNSALNKKAWQIYGYGLIPRVLHGDVVTIVNLGIDHAFFNTDSGASAFVGCAGSSNSKPAVFAEVTIENCYAGGEVTLIGHSVGVFRGAGRGANTYIRNCYSLATVNAVGDYGLASMAWECPITIEGCFNANGTLATASSTVKNSYQTVAGKHKTVTTVENMKGSDVLTNADKMPLLDGTKFVTYTENFEERDFFIYLPQGTVFEEEFKVEFYNGLFTKMDTSTVLLENEMLIGAYVKFFELPDCSKITLPAESKAYVRYGTKTELQLSNPYYGVKMDFISDKLNADGNSVKYAFITDIHYISGEDTIRSLATVRQIKQLVKYVNENDDIDFIAIGGDSIQGTQSKSASLGYLEIVFTPFLDCNKPVVIVPGNHDDNSYAYDTKSFDGSQVITDKEWNDKIIDVYVNRDLGNGQTVTVSQDKTVENTKYFYYDLTSKKTRIICLDSIDYEQTYDENGKLTVDANGNVGLAIRNESAAVTNYNRYYTATTYWGYGARQMEWLAEDALCAGDDWNYIFISHMGIDEATNFNEGAEITHYGKDLRNIIKAYQFKTEYVNTELGISADFSNTSGKILSYQFGHTHKQNSLYSADVDLWQINSSTAQVRNGYFDIMTVNETAINRYNVGKGYDERFFLTKNALAGDLNKDKVSNICDLVQLNVMSSSDTAKQVSADVDGNKTIDFITDLAALRTIIISR